MGNGVVILRAASAWTMSALTPSWPNETRDNVQLLLLDASRDLLTRSRRRRNEKLNLTGRPDAIRYRQGSRRTRPAFTALRSEEHTSELQSLTNLVCRLLLEKKK